MRILSIIHGQVRASLRKARSSAEANSAPGLVKQASLTKVSTGLLTPNSQHTEEADRGRVSCHAG